MIVPLSRFFYLLSVGFILSGLGLINEKIIFLQYMFYSILFFLIFLDFLLIIRKKDINMKREHEKYLSIGVDNIIKISVENKTRKSFKLQVRDEYPVGFIVLKDTMNLNLKALSYYTVSYYVKPLKKGEYDFNIIYVRISGKLGLVARQYKYKISSKVKVYPNLIEVKKYLNLMTRSRIAQLGYKKRLSGGETEFDFLREYQTGDDYKHINWKATAKKNFPIVQVYQKEYNRNILVFLDTGRMMTTMYDYMTKLDFSVDASLILAAASKHQQDHFGLLAFSENIVSFLPPIGKGNKVLTDILAELYNIHPTFSKTDYKLAYKYSKSKIRKNSLIFIFSELYNKVVSKDLIMFLKLLNKNHKVNLISFEEIEDEVKGNDNYEITRWVVQKDQYIEKEGIIRDLKKQGINVIRVNADNIKQKVVNSYLAL